METLSEIVAQMRGRGADVRMTAGRPVCVTFPARSYTFTHPSGDCVVRRFVVFVNLREAREWAAAWNRRAGA